MLSIFRTPGRIPTPAAPTTKFGRQSSPPAINLVALEISSFKCGHDAPIYGVVEGIIEQSGTPYFCFKDLDENKPSGSIRIRVETIDYFLRRYREEIIKKRKASEEIEAQLATMEEQLRGQCEQEAQGMAAD